MSEYNPEDQSPDGEPLEIIKAIFAAVGKRAENSRAYRTHMEKVEFKRVEGGAK
jgi:hypothetical protein